APLGFIGMLHWREPAVGRRNDARQRGGLRQCDSRQILSEICRRRLAEAVNAERTALAHVDFVGGHGENLLFRQPLLKQERKKNFGDFPPDRTVGRQEEISRKLLRDGTGASDARRAVDAVNERSYQANGIDSPMRKEMLVLSRDQSVD